MGYELHIVRQTNYQDGEEASTITLEEWLAYVATDQELELTNGFEYRYPGHEPIWQEVPGFCNWLAHPVNDGDALPWFSFGNGCISTKNPDGQTIEKMINISIALHARLRGDHFEYYDETYFTNGGYPIPEQQQGFQIDKPIDNKPWWKFW